MLVEEADRRPSIHEEISGEYGLVVDASTINQMEECVGNHAGRLTELENVMSTVQTHLNNHLHQIMSLVSENRPQTTRKLESALRCVSSEVKSIAVQIAALGVGDFAAQMATMSQIQSRLGAHASQLQDQFNKIQSDVQMQTRELEALGSKQSEMKATLGRHIANLDCDLDTYHKELQQVRDSQKRTDERLQKFLKTQSGINDKLTGNIGIASDKLTETKTKTSQSSINAELNKAIGKQREGLCSMVNNVQNVVEDLSKFKRVQRSVNTDTSNNLTQLQNTVAKVSSNVQKTVDSKLKTALDPIYAVQNHLNIKLHKFEGVDIARVAAVEALKKDLTILQGTVKTHGNKLEVLPSEITGIQKPIKSNSDRMDGRFGAHVDKLDTPHAQVTATGKHVEDVMSELLKNHKELSDYMKGLGKRVEELEDLL